MLQWPHAAELDHTAEPPENYTTAQVCLMLTDDAWFSCLALALSLTRVVTRVINSQVRLALPLFLLLRARSHRTQALAIVFLCVTTIVTRMRVSLRLGTRAWGVGVVFLYRNIVRTELD